MAWLKQTNKQKCQPFNYVTQPLQLSKDNLLLKQRTNSGDLSAWVWDKSKEAGSLRIPVTVSSFLS